MLPPLRDNERRLLMELSLMVCCGALCILPLTAQSSTSAQAEASDVAASVSMPATPDRLRFPAVALSRDPFVPDRSLAPRGENDGGDVGIVLPPNAAAGDLPDALPQANGAAPLVRAVVLGTQSRALIETGGHVAVLGVGDAIGTAHIVAIDAGGVELDSGARIAIAAAGAKTR